MPLFVKFKLLAIETVTCMQTFLLHLPNTLYRYVELMELPTRMYAFCVVNQVVSELIILVLVLAMMARLFPVSVRLCATEVFVLPAIVPVKHL